MCILRWFLVMASAVCLIPGEYAAGQFVQQGNKLFGKGAAGAAQQGIAVSLSSDGNTAVVGGVYDSSGAGAAWVFARSGGLWSQQGTKLVATDALGNAQQGCAVSISSDGNTALVGGGGDNGGVGAAWIYTRSGGVWAKQAKLVGTGIVGFFAAAIGSSAALSADGTTAILGGPTDNSLMGAAWIFVKSGSAWTQQAKVVGTGAPNYAWQGYAVAISADGNTAIIGGPYDSTYAGAAWVFIRTGSAWTQQGPKLVGHDASGYAQQGYSVAISADGNTALVGGISDGNGPGAAWVFTRAAGTWTQQGSKLVGSNCVPPTTQGYSVSLSSDGNLALVAAPSDDYHKGGAWVFARSGSTWTQSGTKLIGSGAVGAAFQGCAAAISGDGKTVILGGITDSSNSGAAWIFAQTPAGVDRQVMMLPGAIRLEQNYPNPFNPATIIRYEIPMRAYVTLDVSNVLGQIVAEVVKEHQDAGVHEAVFNASGLPSGVYCYRLKAGNTVRTKTLIVLR